MFKERGRQWNVTPNNFPTGLRVFEEQGAKSIADGVDFRTRRVTASLPLEDRYNEEVIVDCDVQLDDGAMFDSSRDYRPTGYYLTLEDLQVARKAAGREPLTQQELDELKKQRERKGLQEVKISWPRIIIPTRQPAMATSPKRKGVLARIRDAFIE